MLTLISQLVFSLTSPLFITTPNNFDDISQIEVTDITQDVHGFMWFGTKDGLNRYDGYNYTIYRPNKEQSNSLIHHNIYRLLNTSNNHLLIATAGGFQRYVGNQAFDDVDVYNYQGQLTHKVAAIELFETQTGDIWVGSVDAGITILDKNLKPQKNFNTNNSVLKSDYVTSFSEDKANNVWIGTKKGLYVYDAFQRRILSAGSFNPALSSLDNTRINALVTISNQLFIGTSQGLTQYNFELNKISIILENSSPSISNNYITKLVYLDSINALAIGTLNGLNLFYIDSEVISQYTNNTITHNRVKSSNIYSLFVSADDVFWIGGSGGLNKSPLEARQFGHYVKNNSLYPCEGFTDFYAVAIENKHNIWVASYSGPLMKLNLKSNTCETFNRIKIEDRETSLNNILAIKVTSSIDVWLATRHLGLLHLNPQAKSFSSISGIPKSARIKSLTENKSNLFATTYYEGTYRIDKATKIAVKLSSKESSLNGHVIYSTSDNSLFLVDRKFGLSEITDQGDIKRIFENEIKETPFKITSITEDQSGSLWISTQGYGLYQYDRRSNNFVNYSVNNSQISSNLLWQVMADNQNRIWTFGSKGVSILNLNSKKFINFDSKDGLQENAFTPTGDFNRQINMMLTGGINGFNYFSPSHITDVTPFLSVTLTNIKVNNQPFQGKPNTEKGTILDYQNNNLSFGFSSNNFTHPQKVKFSYRLLSNNESWIETTANERIATFTNLTPGDYEFQVKASDTTGSWPENYTSYKFTIEAPWWMHPGAYFFYLVTTAILLFCVIKYREKRLTKKAKELELIVKNRTYELNQEKQIVEQLLSRKNDEFTNFSHEFRTPLTLILGPLEKLKQELPSQSELKLESIQRNANRLLRMVDQMLSLETFQIQAITQKHSIAVGKTIRFIADAFSDLAFQKNITFNVGTIDDVTFDFTPDAIDKIILNLLSNALKYTPPGGQVFISAKRDNQNYVINIKDTGIGIPVDKQEQVFERFNRVLNEDSERVVGAGIGLSLVKNLVEHHQGNIKLISTPNKGTLFEISLPIINEKTNNSSNDHKNSEIVSTELVSLNNEIRHSSNKTPEAMDDDSSKPTLLIVEDNWELRQYLIDSFSNHFICDEASNGKQGFARAIANVPDIIISDIMMPEMDGYQLVEALRSNEITSHIPIILLTAKNDKQSRLKGWEQQADEYIAKPFDIDELSFRVKNLLDIRSILKRRFHASTFQKDKELKPNKELVQQSKEAAFINKMNAIIENNYQNESFRMSLLANDIGVSERQLHRKLKAIMDLTPTEYLRSFRLNKAKELLAKGEPASNVYLDVGFSSHSYFGKCFKAQYGCSPSEYSKEEF
ncbi:hybrid sensor histidine kinase/response regulator transcription factor [Pleionea sediminis]|uniref:hybrid sensor histidine kinase/response regulator transcription factor n=1 Tax=Pleionea sediminis TaxID=2569479 RepID=UPI0013DDEF16|nr:ATP-binding protein [Pleionea sediminis]